MFLDIWFNRELSPYLVKDNKIFKIKQKYSLKIKNDN